MYPSWPGLARRPNPACGQSKGVDARHKAAARPAKTDVQHQLVSNDTRISASKFMMVPVDLSF
jgi:hypothetical protein